jgi:hypothetical protein
MMQDRERSCGLGVGATVGIGAQDKKGKITLARWLRLT